MVVVVCGGVVVMTSTVYYGLVLAMICLLNVVSVGVVCGVWW